MGTKFWGPLGWMTLHSVSAIYPEKPTLEEKLLLERFVENYRECITCPHCKSHFSAMLNTYKRSHPEWSSSRFDFFVFVCRAHNTVNRRLDKPVLQTLDDCIQRLKDVTKVTNGGTYRAAYINYLLRNWSVEQTGEGFMNISITKQLKKINEEYFNPRDTGFENLKFDRDANVLEFIAEDPKRYDVGGNLPNAAVGFNRMRIGLVNGRFKIR
jgi:FAD-linked sulfhydryl oxidase